MRSFALALLVACTKVPPPAPDLLAVQRERAAEEGRSQTLEQCRLATMELAEGNLAEGESALRFVVPRMQSMRADGEFAAMIGAEDRKEWKGEPYEKMAAYHALGALLLAKGDADNALAMGKSAILADTGTAAERTRSDFAAGYLLQALAYRAEGETGNAERFTEAAVDAVWQREMGPLLSDALMETAVDGDANAVAAARVLLLAGLAPALSTWPRDPSAAVDRALAVATELRSAAMDPGPPPYGTEQISAGGLRKALEPLGALHAKWLEAARALPSEALAPARDGEAAIRTATGDHRLVVWVQAGRGPRKVQYGRYGEQLVVLPGRVGSPELQLDGVAVRADLVDDFGWQATTRGGRRVDAFLRGKAVFKDVSGVLGIGLAVVGDVISDSARSQEGETVGGVLQLVGVAVWLVGVASNPEADVRAWEGVPGGLWVAVADPSPGRHTISMGGYSVDVDVPAEGTAVALIPLTPRSEER